MIESLSLLESEHFTTSRVLLIDDQYVIFKSVQAMLKEATDIQLFYCQDPTQALETAERVQPTVILQDLMMPEIDGLLLLRYFRANEKTRNVPLVMLSAEEEPIVKAQAFAQGANDYIVKLPNRVELLARLRYHSQNYIRLLERDEAFRQLEMSQSVLKSELAEAARYVRSILPAPVEDSVVAVSWEFIPSTLLGGDCFGYHWLDEDHFAIYLLDVCGHGVGAALLSSSVANMLRSQQLIHTDFYTPGDLLTSLNGAFLMEKHDDRFFTMWYGVYNRKTGVLRYASGGHPPAILLSGTNVESLEVTALKTPGLVIGGMASSKFTTCEHQIAPFSRLFIFSDGAYELSKERDATHLDHLIEVLKSSVDDEISSVIEFARAHAPQSIFQDDFSIIKVLFK